MANDNYTNRTAGISIRQYVLTLLATMAFMPTYAQSHVSSNDPYISQEEDYTVVQRYRSDAEREADKHLKFKEVQINGTVEDITKTLVNKGMKNGKYFVWNNKNMEINVKSNDNKTCVYEVHVSCDLGMGQRGKEKYNKFIAELRKSIGKYPHTKLYQFSDPVEPFDIYEVRNNLNEKIGEIVIDYLEPLTATSSYVINISYIDHTNALKNEVSDYPLIPTQWYDYSTFINEKGTKCYLATTGNGLYVKYIRNNTVNNRLLRGEDKETILSVLALNNNDTRKKTLFTGYIDYANRGIDGRTDNYKITYNDLEDKTRLYVSQLQKQQQSSKTIVQNVFLDMLRNAIFSKKEQEMFKGAGISTEMQNQLIKSTISSSGGNGKVCCGDCGLMFSNSADLRSHQNAVHGH